MTTPTSHTTTCFQGWTLSTSKVAPDCAIRWLPEEIPAGLAVRFRPVEGEPSAPRVCVEPCRGSLCLVKVHRPSKPSLCYTPRTGCAYDTNASVAQHCNPLPAKSHQFPCVSLVSSEVLVNSSGESLRAGLPPDANGSASRPRHNAMWPVTRQAHLSPIMACCRHQRLCRTYRPPQPNRPAYSCTQLIPAAGPQSYPGTGSAC